MTEHLVAITTLSGEEDAARLARALVERGLVACVNILPAVRSLYRWKDAIEDDREQLLLMKTRADRYAALASAIEELHPYEVPELIAVPVELGSRAYLAWVDESVSASRDRSG